MHELLYGAANLLVYFLTAASLALGCRFLCSIPDEVFRKTLHLILLGSYIPFLFSFSVWWKAVLLAILLEIAIYPILAFFERFQNYTAITTQRREGEFKQSLLLAFTMLSAAMTVCWGWMGDRYLVLVCMYAWGVGDVFAALVGKKFGRHKIRLKYADHRKSVEGSLAMFLTSALAVMVVLLFRGGMHPAGYVVIPAAAAGTAALVEMHTKGGYDTITCPSAAMVVTLPLMALFGGMT